MDKKRTISQTNIIATQKNYRASGGKAARVKTMAILSAEKPMVIKTDDDYDKEAQAKLIRNLKTGNFIYYKMEGNYGGVENSVMIYNITLEDAKLLAYRYSQESMVFVDMTNPPKVSFQYLESEGRHGPLTLQKEENKIIDENDEEKYYTEICNTFKFRIPFFELLAEMNNILKKKESKYDVDRLIAQSIDSKYTGQHRYICRSKLYSHFQ